MTLLNRKRVGLLLRTFAMKEEDVTKRVKAVTAMVTKAKALEVDGKPVFSRIDVLVWADKRYADADCGQTFAAMRTALSGEPKVTVTEFKAGDLFCGILNYGVSVQTRDRIDYTMIASTEAISYLTPEMLSDMFAAVGRGARAVGAAIDDIFQSVLEGQPANAMCLWHNESLQSVGGFDLLAAKPFNPETAFYLRGADNGQPVFYHAAGVEEMIPLARMIEIYGPCIGAVEPRGEGVKAYKVPDPATERELYDRYINKVRTKEVRTGALLGRIGYHLSFLRTGLVPSK